MRELQFVRDGNSFLLIAGPCLVLHSFLTIHSVPVERFVEVFIAEVII